MSTKNWQQSFVGPSSGAQIYLSADCIVCVTFDFYEAHTAASRLIINILANGIQLCSANCTRFLWFHFQLIKTLIKCISKWKLNVESTRDPKSQQVCFFVESTGHRLEFCANWVEPLFAAFEYKRFPTICSLSTSLVISFSIYIITILRTDKSIGDTSDIISDSSGVGTNSDSAVCSIGHPSTTVVCIEPYSSSTIGHLSIQTGEVIEVLGSTDCGLLEGYVRGTNRSGFFPVEVVQEVNIRHKNNTEHKSTFQKRQDAPQQPPQQQHMPLESFCVRIQRKLIEFQFNVNFNAEFLFEQQQQQPNQQQAIYQRNTIIGATPAEQSMQDEFIGHGQAYSSATAPRQKKM